MFIYLFELAELVCHNSIPFIRYFLGVWGWSIKCFYYKHVLTFCDPSRGNTLSTWQMLSPHVYALSLETGRTPPPME